MQREFKIKGRICIGFQGSIERMLTFQPDIVFCVHRKRDNLKVIQTCLANFNGRAARAHAWLKRHEIKNAMGIGAFCDIDHRRIDMDVVHQNFSKQQMHRVERHINSIYANQFLGLPRPRGRKNNHGFHGEIPPAVPMRFCHHGLGAAFLGDHRGDDPIQGWRETQQTPN